MCLQGRLFFSPHAERSTYESEIYRPPSLSISKIERKRSLHWRNSCRWQSQSYHLRLLQQMQSFLRSGLMDNENLSCPCPAPSGQISRKPQFNQRRSDSNTDRRRGSICSTHRPELLR